MKLREKNNFDDVQKFYSLIFIICIILTFMNIICLHFLKYEENTKAYYAKILTKLQNDDTT